MNYPIEIGFKKGRLYLLSVATIVFVLLCGWYTTSPEVNFPFSPWVVVIIGWVGLLFFGAGLFYIIRMILRNRPALRINTTGLHDRTTAIAVGRIDWEHIEGFRSESVFGNHFILVETNAPDEYISRGEGKLVQQTLKANQKKYGTPITISTNNITMGHRELLALLKSELKNYRALPDDLRMELREALPRELREDRGEA